MPSFHDHYEHSRHNLAFLDSFFLERFNDWSITVMFYAGVHIAEAILDKDCSIHSHNHQDRTGNLAKLTSFPKYAYKALEREAHNSRYKKYKVYTWESYRIFKEHFQKLVAWFNSNVDENSVLNTQVCKDIADAWLKRCNIEKFLSLFRCKYLNFLFTCNIFLYLTP